MTNHPNRGPKGQQSNPSPQEIIAARQAAGLTQTEAGALVYSGCRAWQAWEAGERRMHPSTWELFLRKSAPVREPHLAFLACWGDDVGAGDTIGEAASADWLAACGWCRGSETASLPSAKIDVTK